MTVVQSGQALIADIDRADPGTGNLCFWWMGQLSYIVKAGGRVLYFDPYLTPGHARLIPPMLAPEEIEHADLVFGSHDHADHIDPMAIQGIADASQQARFVVSRVAADHLRTLGVLEESIVALDEGIVLDEPGLRVTAIPAAHELLHKHPSLGYPYLSFVVETGGVTMLHTGDTCIYPGYIEALRPWSLDVIFAPINGRDAERLARGCIGNMTYQETVDLAGELRPRLTVPGHYDMFADNAEDVGRFARYMEIKYPDLRYWIGDHGQRATLSAELTTH